MSALGRLLIFTGLLIAGFGLLILLLGRLAPERGGLLPGDIYIRRGNFTFYFPIATCILLSVILSLIFYLLAGRR